MLSPSSFLWNDLKDIFAIYLTFTCSYLFTYFWRSKKDCVYVIYCLCAHIKVRGVHILLDMHKYRLVVSSMLTVPDMQCMLMYKRRNLSTETTTTTMRKPIAIQWKQVILLQHFETWSKELCSMLLDRFEYTHRSEIVALDTRLYVARC